MSNYINKLPEEIINIIYKKVFDSCLHEVNNINSCCMCDKIINSENNFSCKNCNEKICLNCWTTYCTNYGRGWKPFIYNCKTCAIEKMNTEGLDSVLYPN